jgi:hypothetical protein
MQMLRLFFFSLLLPYFLAIDEFSKQFISNYPNGSQGFHAALRARNQWTSLSFWDHTKTIPNPRRHETFDSLGPVIQCPPQLFSTFAKGDDEKRVCGLMTQPCVVVSLGSGNRWDFEAALLEKHPFCQIHTFDCYTPSVVPSNLQNSVFSYNKCIGPRDENLDGRQFLSWTSIMTLIGATSAPIVLKMDIEGFEWTVIRSMIASSPSHLLPTSISFELHTSTIVPEIDWSWRPRQGAEVALLMEYLMKNGYLLVDRHDNPYCPHCTELVVARVMTHQKR